MPIWNPGQYLKFGAERTRPSLDLCARIPGSPGRILDLGCGPGNSTAVLRERWPEAELAGLDSSAEMIAQARASHPAGSWILAGAESYVPPQALDLVFSNAVLQWLPDHPRLLPRLMGWLAPGGCLAVQMPAMSFHEASFYYDLLAPTAQVDLWETVYHHPMASHQALIEWYEGTGMRPYLERLPDDAARAAFKAELLEECRGEYPVMADGKVVMPFKRLFFLAWKV
jgi:trans-aconitate 2-methyltransferase